MRLSRHATVWVAASTLLMAGLAGCSSDDAGASGTIVIGADLNRSSAADTAYARALQLRIDQINTSGQLGRRKLELQTQDNRSDPTVSLRNLSTFAADPTVAAVVTGDCDVCIVGASKTINDKRLPVISLAASDAVVNPVADRRYIFKLGPNSTDSAAAMVTELRRVTAPKVTKVAVLYSDDLYGSSAEEAIKAELLKAQIDQKIIRKVQPSSNDVSQAVNALTGAKPDALLVLTAPEQATLAVTAAKASGFAGRIYFDAAAAGDLFIPADAVGATENTTMVFTQILAIDDVIATTPAKASRKQWFRDYTSRYGGYSGVASFAADASNLIADAVARAGTDRDRIRDILETSQVDGLSGPIRFTPDNHSGLMPQALTLLVARSGRWRLTS